MASFPSAGVDIQSATFFSFSATVTGTDFGNTSFANMTEAVILDDIPVSATSNITVDVLLNRIQHLTAAIPVFCRVELSAVGFTSQFSEIASIGSSYDFNYKQMFLTHLFADIPVGTYKLEVQLRVASGTCMLPNDSNGAGTRVLKAIVVSV